MIEKILDIAFSGFWPFIGILTLINVVLYYVTNFFIRIWIRFMRLLTINRNGWPPPHLDGDGDFKKSEREESEDEI